MVENLHSNVQQAIQIEFNKHTELEKLEKRDQLRLMHAVRTVYRAAQITPGGVSQLAIDLLKEFM